MAGGHYLAVDVVGRPDGDEPPVPAGHRRRAPPREGPRRLAGAAAQAAGERRDRRRPLDQRPASSAAHSPESRPAPLPGATRAPAAGRSRAASGTRPPGEALSWQVRGNASMVGHVEQRRERRQPDQLGLGEVDAVLGGFCSTASQTSQSGVVGSRAGSSTPAPARALRSRSRWPGPGQPTAGLADPPRDPLRQLHIVAVEVDVVGDQERPGANGHRARLGWIFAGPKSGSRPGWAIWVLRPSYWPRRTSASR